MRNIRMSLRAVSRLVGPAAAVLLGALVAAGALGGSPALADRPAVPVLSALEAPAAQPGGRVAGQPVATPAGPYPLEPDTQPAAGGPARGVLPCTNGFINENGTIYPCNSVDLYARVPLTGFPSLPNGASGIWGFTDLDDNREYAIVGLRNATVVVDITNPASPVIIGSILGTQNNWREIKVYQFYNSGASRWDAYAYVSTEAGGGIQIIDMTELPNSISLAGTYSGVNNAHSLLVSNVDPYTGAPNQPGLTPLLIINGSNLGGFRMLSLTNPVNPVEVGAGTGSYAHEVYTHVFTDTRASQCAPNHNPCEVVFNFTGYNGINVVDVTDKANPFLISNYRYPRLGYTHSGWASADGQYLFVDDELDEQSFGTNSVVRTIAIDSLTNLRVTGYYTGPTHAVDHIGFTVGNRFILAHDSRGAVVLDVSTPNAPVEIGVFDSYPENDNAIFAGAWGMYPFYHSGSFVISDRTRGLFVLRLNGAGATPTPTASATLAPTQTATATASATPAAPTPTPTAPPSATPSATPTAGPPASRALLPVVLYNSPVR
jgi:choice-of-anchor B domain-containing protein